MHPRSAKTYPTVRLPAYGHEAVATSQPLAARAGLSILEAGGNAVDAALATAIALTVVEPCSNGIGSDAFSIIWDGNQLHGLNASGRAPMAWSPDYFAGQTQMPLWGWDAVTVPGAVSGWVEMSRRFGRLPFARLFEPAIEYAQSGFVVTPLISRRWAISMERLKNQPGFSDVFSNQGQIPGAGETWRLPALARGLEEIAASEGESFYRGEIAKALINWAQQHGGVMSAEDLDSHSPDWVGTIATHYRGADGTSYDLHEIPPNGQGITALIALGILRHIDLAHLDPDSPEAQHLQIEAIKIAFADAYRYVSDPTTMEFDPNVLLDDDYLASRATLISPGKAQEFSAGKPPRGGTVYLTAADRDGMMVSMIQSNYMGFGSGVVEPTFGISLQNRGNGFQLAPHPNQVGPGKRPFHTIIPGFLMREGKAQLSFGVMGGHMQPQGHLQTLIRMLTYGMNPQEACDAPRFRWNQGLEINLENSFSAKTRERLASWGHQVAERNESESDFGSGQFIWSLHTKDRGDRPGYLAATDPRTGGAALVR